MDWTYLLVLIGAAICFMASANVKSTFNKYSRIQSMSGMTGAMAAERILYAAGITDVRVMPIAGDLTDNYRPGNKTLFLSESVYGSNSVAAVGVAAHECGHAIQHAKGYAPLSLRSVFVPVANFGSKLSWPVILIGGLLMSQEAFYSTGWLVVQIGIILFSFAFIFQLITLPVEFDASRRAMQMLKSQGILQDRELTYTGKVLGAAALTYVASATATLLQLLRLVLIFGGRRRD